MKRVLTIVLSVFILIGCEGQIKKNHLQEFNLKGKVKSVKERWYKAIEKFGEVEKGDRDCFEASCWDLFFDEKGNLTSVINYNSDGKLLQKHTCKYDERGNCIEVISHNSDGSLEGKSISKYDKKGNKIEQIQYSSYGSLLVKLTYKYDEKGNQIEVITHNPNNPTRRLRNTYKYNEKGEVIEEFTEFRDNAPDEILFRKTYKYDEKGNKIESVAYKTHKYNEKGDKIEHNSDESLHSKTTHKYKYDDKNNWIQGIQETENEEGKAKYRYIIEREIEYY